MISKSVESVESVEDRRRCRDIEGRVGEVVDGEVSSVEDVEI